MRTVVVLARAGFRRCSTYRLATLADPLTNSVFGLNRASILLAAVAVRVDAIPLAPRTVLPVLGMIVPGAVIVSALFVAASALRLFLVEGSEVTNAFVYGGSYALQQSAPVFPHPLRLLFTLVVPAAFVAYLPTVVLLGSATAMTMLTGILRPTSVTMRTYGADPMRHRRDFARRVGVVFGQRSQLWWDLPLHESPTILGAIHAIPAAQARARAVPLVEQLEMGETLGTPVRQLSLGRRGAERAERGPTLLLTTHDMGVLERLSEGALVPRLQQRLACDATTTTAAEVLGAVSARAAVRDLVIEEPDLEEVVRRICTATR